MANQAPELEICGLCNGEGTQPHPNDPVSYTCEQCGGTGFMPDDIDDLMHCYMAPISEDGS